MNKFTKNPKPKFVGAKPELGLQGNDAVDHASITNFYAWLDQIADEVYAKYDWWPCLVKNRDKPNACLGGCCSHSAFMVSESEFAEIYELLRKRPKEEWDFIVRRARALFEDYLRARIAQGHSLVDICLEVAPMMFTCPLLNLRTGRCSVYEVRPIICRTFGHFLDAKHKTTFYSDRVAKALEERVEETGETIALPDWDIVRREMAHVIKGRAAPIPLWILIYAGEIG